MVFIVAACLLVLISNLSRSDQIKAVILNKRVLEYFFIWMTLVWYNTKSKYYNIIIVRFYLKRNKEKWQTV